MSAVEGLNPQEVWYYFEQISRIPRGSGNMEQISNFMVKFAKDLGLFCIQDELKNIIIVKEATPGYEKEPAVILQGHMDMVTVKKPGCDKDLLTEGLDLMVEGDYLYAKDTSLGGDDGIAVAYCMALLASKDIPHPKLEVVLTVEEEVGLDGARGIDVSMLTGKRMLNLDSEEEGIFLSSCAGGARAKVRFRAKEECATGLLCHIRVDGLIGGHSGVEIIKERGNSNCLVSRALFAAAARIPLRIVNMSGGEADNAIPRETEAVVLLPTDKRDAMDTVLKEELQDWKDELSSKDPDVNMSWHFKEVSTGVKAATAADTNTMLQLLVALPGGVQGMSKDIEGLVETSLNMGILGYEEGLLKSDFSVRSSIESKKKELISKVTAIAALAGGTCEIKGDYPGWKYCVNSPVRDKAVAIYERLYGKKPEIRAIHAGVECGFLVSKIPGLDCISMGPDILDIHTTEEKLSLSSTKRVWEFLLTFLQEKE